MLLIRKFDKVFSVHPKILARVSDFFSLNI